MKSPLFSIIIPTYNRAKLITDTINSCLKQDLTGDFEVIIVDDGSTDDTRLRVQSINDERVKYVWQENAERGRARNHGAELSRGKYLNFFDSDDILHSHHLSNAQEFIQRHDPDMFWQPHQFVKPNGQILKQVKAFKKSTNEQLIDHGNVLAIMGVFMKREVFLRCPFNEDRKLSGSEDYELWLRLAARHKILKNWILTSSVVQHDDRSVFNFAPEPLITRLESLVRYIKEDEDFMKTYGDRFRIIKSEAESYIALHGVMSSDFPTSQAISYFKRSLKTNPRSIFRRRTLGFGKQLLSRYLTKN